MFIAHKSRVVTSSVGAAWLAKSITRLLCGCQVANSHPAPTELDAV